MRLLRAVLVTAMCVGASTSAAHAQNTEPDVVEPAIGSQNVVVEWRSGTSLTPDEVKLPQAAPGSSDRLVSQNFPGPALVTGLTWTGESPDRIWLQQQSSGQWGAWELLSTEHPLDHDHGTPTDHGSTTEGTGEGDRPGTDAIVLADPDAFRFLVEGPIDNARVFLFNDAPTPASRSSAAFNDPEIRWPGPSFVRDRGEWDTDGCRIPGAEFDYSSPQAIIVHHTAGSNSYSQGEVPAILRGLCTFSTGSRGFDDVGYNFLVDRFGTVWEGRTGSKSAPIRGAHALAFNSSTQAVALLGNFDSVAPPTAQVNGLGSMLDWLTGRYDIDPDGMVTLIAASDGPGVEAGEALTVMGIAGHREVGQTACPGEEFFPQLSAIAASTRPTRFDEDPPSDEPVVTGEFGKDANGDGFADLLAWRTSDWDPYTYFGNGMGGFLPDRRLPAGQMPDNTTDAFSPGDWDGDGTVDVIGRLDNGWLMLYPGDGDGRFGAGRRIGTGFNTMTHFLSPGDWNGDEKPDIITVRSDGAMILFAGDGRGGFSGPYPRIGRGWGGFNDVFSPGDWDGDGAADILARNRAGSLFMYRGDGNGGFVGPYPRIGTGWGSFVDLDSSGDFDHDGASDILAFKPSGQLCLYRGNGAGRFSSLCVPIGRGFQIFDRLL